MVANSQSNFIVYVHLSQSDCRKIKGQKIKSWRVGNLQLLLPKFPLSSLKRSLICNSTNNNVYWFLVDEDLKFCWGRAWPRPGIKKEFCRGSSPASTLAEEAATMHASSSWDFLGFHALLRCDFTAEIL